MNKFINFSSYIHFITGCKDNNYFLNKKSYICVHIINDIEQA